MNLADNLARSAAANPSKAAVKLDDVVLTYSALQDTAARTAGWLHSMGVRPGDRVSVMLPNLPHFPVLYYGILWAGAVVVPMNPLYKSREVEFILSDASARAIFAWDGVAEEAGKGAAEAGSVVVEVVPAEFMGLVMQHEAIPLVQRSAQDTAVVLYTSGTTGSPKGAELTHANVLRNTDAVVDLFSLTSQDVIFGGLPLFHAFGQIVGMSASVAAGATITLIPRFEPGRALQVIERDRVTVLEAVPTMYVALLQHPGRQDYDVSSLRLCASGGASLPVEVLHGFERAFGAAILEGYGLSETSPVASFNHADRVRKPGSIGQPIAGVEFRLVDSDWNDVPAGGIGEIAIKGHNVMKGYLGRPEATEEAMNGDWFRTGDLARRDDEGYYFIVDRAKDMIIRGGYNVYPREVEEVLYEHPAVASAAVVGIPHEALGEEVAAAVILKPGAAATPQEIVDFVKERVAPFKYPRVVWITGALPMGPTGKILKREISIPAEETPNR